MTVDRAQMLAGSDDDEDVQTNETPSPTIGDVVAEALTNVAKHSGARQAIVRLQERELAGSRRLVVEVHDDGRGGASVDLGSGLRGLHDRVVAVEGSMVLTSPVGGPTSIVVELPCGS